MEEKSFFANGTVTVTQNQLIVENQTFELAGVTSIKIGETPPNRRLSGNTAIIGALCLSLDAFFFVVGLILLGVAGFLWKTTKPQYSIILNTPSGEKPALISDNKEYVEQVFSALNQALLSRE